MRPCGRQLQHEKCRMRRTLRLKNQETIMSHITRRALLERGLQFSVGAFAAGLSACGGSSEDRAASANAPGGPLCADPHALNASEANARTAFGYVEHSADSQKVCASCAFFHAAAESGGCGTCDIFNGGPANPGGYCNSWTAADKA